MTSELYQQTILDHNRKPRNFGPLERPTRTCHGHNPLCGDDMTVYVRTDDQGRIEAVSFQGSGCAISKASASMMTQALSGKTVEEARVVFDEFHRMLLGEFDPETSEHHLGKLKIFKGVREFPSRIKCASLAWHAVHAALEGDGPEVTTE